MPTYTCPRCHYNTSRKSSFISHCKRKYQCNCDFSTISLSKLIRNISLAEDVTMLPKCYPKLPDVTQNAEKNVTRMLPNVTRMLPDKKINVTRMLPDIAENKKYNTYSYYCSYCDKGFKFRSGKSRHESSRCKEKHDNTGLVTELFSQLNNERSEKKELMNQINKLIDKAGDTNIKIQHTTLEHNQTNNNNTIENNNNTIENNQTNNTIENNQTNNTIENNQTNNTIGNNQNNYNNTIENQKTTYPKIIKPRDYGDENMEHITHDFCKELLKEPYSGPNKLVRAIHFDPNYIENYNIKATNQKLNVAKIIKDGQWEYMNKKTLLNREFIKTNQILDDCFDKEKDNMDQSVRELYERFQIARNELHHYNNTLCNIFVEILNGTNKMRISYKHTLRLLV